LDSLIPKGFYPFIGHFFLLLPFKLINRKISRESD